MSDKDPPSFPTSYAEGRSRFVELVAATDGKHETHKHPLQGPAGETLFLDVAICGPGAASKVLLLIAGTHGIEGFAGSGIMATLLGEGLPERLPEDLKLVMIHALNPHGFAWERRVNEDNVDLNRNFVDHEAGHPVNARYADLAELVTPSRWTEKTAADIRAGFEKFEEQHKVSAFSVLSKGQYEYPDGFFYGGRTPAWSNWLLANIAEKHLAAAGQVLAIDIHTGLGEFGEAEYIVEYAPDSPQYLAAEAIWGEDVRSTLTGASSSPEVSGSVISGLAATLGDHVVGMGLEFGTVALDKVAEALMADRWLYYHGERDSALGSQIRAKMHDAFYPDSAKWQQSITDTARRVVQQALDHAVEQP